MLLALAVGMGIGAILRPEAGPKEVTISIVGDIMLSRGVQKYLDEYGYGYPYEDVCDWFLQDDLTIGNLECPITDNGGAANKAKRFLFRADPENAASLKKAGFDCMNLANNHSMDYMSAGLHDTMKHLKDSGLAYVGASKQASLNKPFLFEKDGIRIGVLAYSALPPEGFFYHADKPTIQYISTMDFSGLEEDIASVPCDFLIVYFHWGIEYQRYKSSMQELIAKKAIDLGADFVVGTHPHVLQEPEVYKERYIYYSLGNFVFDRQIPPGTDETMVLQLTVGRQGLTKVEEIPLVIREGKPAPGVTEEAGPLPSGPLPSGPLLTGVNGNCFRFLKADRMKHNQLLNVQVKKDNSVNQTGSGVSFVFLRTACCRVFCIIGKFSRWRTLEIG